jgi:hypothetical protein
LDEDITVPVAGIERDLGPVPNFRGLEMLIHRPAENVRVDLRFRASPGTYTVDQSARFEIRAGHTFQTIVPILGTAVRLFAIGTVEAPMGILVRGSNRQLLSPVFPHEQELLMVVNESVGAGLASERFFGESFAGWAWMWYSTNAVNYILEVRGSDFAGNVISRVWRLRDAGLRGFSAIIIPPHIMSVVFTNNDAGTREWFFGAVPLWG